MIKLKEIIREIDSENGLDDRIVGPFKIVHISKKLRVEDILVITDSVTYDEGIWTFEVYASAHPDSEQFIIQQITSIVKPLCVRYQIEKSQQKGVFLISCKFKSEK